MAPSKMGGGGYQIQKKCGCPLSINDTAIILRTVLVVKFVYTHCSHEIVEKIFPIGLTYMQHPAHGYSLPSSGHQVGLTFKMMTITQDDIFFSSEAKLRCNWMLMSLQDKQKIIKFVYEVHTYPRISININSLRTHDTFVHKTTANATFIPFSCFSLIFVCFSPVGNGCRML